MYEISGNGRTHNTSGMAAMAALVERFRMAGITPEIRDDENRDVWCNPTSEEQHYLMYAVGIDYSV